MTVSLKLNETKRRMVYVSLKRTPTLPPGVRFPLYPLPGEFGSPLQVASGGNKFNSSSLENDPVPEAVGLAVHLLEDKFERRQAAS